MLKEDAPCNKSSAKQAVSNLSAARSTAPPHSIPSAHVKLYNAVQSARLTVVLQKNVQTWSGTWDDIFVFSAGGAGSAALAHEMRRSSGVYRAKIIADVYDPGGIRADTSTVYTAERIVS